MLVLQLQPLSAGVVVVVVAVVVVVVVAAAVAVVVVAFVAVVVAFVAVAAVPSITNLPIIISYLTDLILSWKGGQEGCKGR